MSKLLEAIRKAELSQKGKSEEKMVENVLKELKLHFTYFDYARRPDARACRGMVGPQPSDFECLINGHQVEIEVKSTKAVKTIPYKNFSQLGMLRRKRMGQATVIAVIYRSKHKLWCMPDFDWMLEDHDPENKASWDISGWKTYESIAELLTKALGLGHELK